MGSNKHRYNRFVPIWYFILISALIALYFVGLYTWYLEISIFSSAWVSIVFFCSVFIVAELTYCTLYHIRRVPRLTAEQMRWNRYATRNRTICIIPCHKAAGGIPPVLERVTQVFGADKVWIADNAQQDNPPDNMREVAESFGVNYVYYPIGNKTNSMYNTLIRATEADPSLEYVVFLDDDTVLKEDFFVRADMFLEDNIMAGYCPFITIKKSDPWNMWEYAVDFEYRMLSFHNCVTGHYHSAKFLHGIVCVYRIDRAKIIYMASPCADWGLPYGEDAWAGLQCRYYNWSLGHDELNMAQTFCPRTLFVSAGREQGYGAASLFKQRCLRWYTSWPRRLSIELFLFVNYDAGSLVGNITQRMEIIYYLYLILVMTIWPYFIIKITFWGSSDSWIVWGWLHFCLFFAAIISGCIRNLGMPKELKVGWDSPLFYPILASMSSYFYGISFWVCMLWFIPYARDERKQFQSGWRDWIDLSQKKHLKNLDLSTIARVPEQALPLRIHPHTGPFPPKTTEKAAEETDEQKEHVELSLSAGVSAGDSSSLEIDLSSHQQSTAGAGANTSATIPSAPPALRSRALGRPVEV